MLGLEVLDAEVVERLVAGRDGRALPGALVEAEREHRAEDVGNVEEVRVALHHARLARAAEPAEGIARVEDVVDDVAWRRALVRRVVGHPDVHRVLLARIPVVHPRGEDAAAAQLAAILVIDRVVRVVAAGAGEVERTDRQPGQPLRRLEAHEAAGHLRAPREGEVERLVVEGVHDAHVVRAGQARGELELALPDHHDLLARRVEAERVVELRADHAGRAGQLGMAGVIGLQQVEALAGDVDAEAQRRAVVLAVIDDPRPVGHLLLGWQHVLGLARARCGVALRGHGLARSVREPCGVGDLVEAVRVDGLAREVDGEAAREPGEHGVVDLIPDERGDVVGGRAGLAIRLLRRGIRAARQRDRIEIGVAHERRAQRERPRPGAADERDDGDAPHQKPLREPNEIRIAVMCAP